jgi:hypothetical protein
VLLLGLLGVLCDCRGEAGPCIICSFYLLLLLLLSDHPELASGRNILRL